MVLVPSALVVSSGGASTERPRAAVLARSSSALREHLGSTDYDDPADLLAAEAGSRQTRPVLRSVPEHDDRASRAESHDHTLDTPQLRQVPDLEPEPEERVREGVSAPLPKRGADDTRVGAGSDREGLPRRRRQTNLAPQLRDEPVPAAGTGEPEPAPHRSPEQARRMMDAFSAGTRRGRAAEIGRDGLGHSSDDQVGAGADDHTGVSD